MTTKILALADALGNLVRFTLLPGRRSASRRADRRHGFRQRRDLAALNERGAKIVISQHPRRSNPLAIDTEIYKWRHLIENFFGKLKQFKQIALRAEKTDQSFAAMIHLVAAVINSR